VRGDNEGSQLLLVCESVLLFLVEIGDYIESEFCVFRETGCFICRLQLAYEKKEVCNQKKNN